MDLNWIAPTILAFAAFVGSMASAWVSVVSAQRAGKAETKSNEAKEQSVQTHLVVNSRMDEFKKLFEEKWKMQGRAEEQDAQKARDLLVAVAAPAAPAALQAIALAEEKAKGLIAKATAEAAQLLAEAHRVSVMNTATEPIPVQVVKGAGVDEPMQVVDTAKKKPR